MVKKTVVIFAFFQISCLPLKNEFDQERFKRSRFTLIPIENPEFYKVIDTSAIYVLKNIYYKEKQIESSFQALKFYKNCKIGKFRFINLDLSESLNPKKAEMGYYNYNNNILNIEFMSYSAQSGSFLTKKRVLFSKDTIISLYGDFKYEYTKIKLPENFLIYKPDW